MCMSMEMSYMKNEVGFSKDIMCVYDKDEVVG